MCGHKGKGKSYLLVAKVRPSARTNPSYRPAASLACRSSPIPDPTYPITQTTAPSSSSLHFEAFDTRGDAAVFKSRMALARILRGRVFVEECQVLETQEFDAHDKACRHVIGLGAVRWCCLT